MMQRIISEHYGSAKHSETGEWDDRALFRTIEVDEVWRKKRVTEIRFSSGEVFDASLATIEIRRKPIASVDID